MVQLVSSNRLLTVSSKSAGPDRLEPLYRVLADRLTDEDRQALDELDSCVDDEAVGHYSARIRTNVIGASARPSMSLIASLGLKPATPLTDSYDDGPNSDELCVGVFATHARINHSCRPTVFWTFSPSTMALSLRALVPIAEGAELFASYTDTTRPRFERMSTLAKTWGFVCTCAGCARPSVEQRASDDRLAAFKTVAARARADQADIQSAVEAYELLVAEGHVAARCDWAWAPCRAALLRGEADAARTWALTAVEAFTLTHGAESEVVGVLRGILDEPENHRLWRARKA